jgi:hypothetical protein
MPVSGAGGGNHRHPLEWIKIPSLAPATVVAREGTVLTFGIGRLNIRNGNQNEILLNLNFEDRN